MLTKALTDDTDKQNKQIFSLTTHRDLTVVELTELLVDKWTGRQVNELRVKKDRVTIQHVTLSFNLITGVSHYSLPSPLLPLGQ